MNKWNQFSLGTKITAVVAVSVSGLLSGGFFILNRSTSTNLERFADTNARNIIENTHNGLVGFMEFGEMDLLQDLIYRNAESQNVQGLRLLADGRSTEYGSSDELLALPIPDTVWTHAEATTDPLILRTSEYLDLYKSDKATDICLDCHDEWEIGDVTSIVHLRYSQQHLRQAKQQFLFNGVTTMGVTVLFLTITLIFATRLLVVKPIVKVAAEARQVASQNLESFLVEEKEIDHAAPETEGEYKGRDEVSALTQSFHWMMNQIRKSIKDAHQKGIAAENAVLEANAEHAQSEEQKLYLAEKVDRMLVEMNRFAEGDLTVHLTTDREDEIAKLYAGFNRAVEELHEIVEGVRLGIEQVAGTSRQISSSTETLSSSAQEQSAQSHEVAAAVEEMVRTIIENAHNATRTVGVSEMNRRNAQEGGEVVIQTVEKIREVGTLTERTAAAIDRFAHSSREIGAIIQAIEDIADQTNLLALNAAIEAARAGDQGRGFAVVADEVRKLAERTSQATKEIAQMIKTIQSETTEAVDVMGKSKTCVGESIALAEQAGEALTGIVSASQDTEDMISQIAAASEEQSSTSEQIARSVDMISEENQKSAIGISEIAGALEALDGLTNELFMLVSRFQTSHHRRIDPDADHHKFHGDGSTFQGVVMPHMQRTG